MIHVVIVSHVTLYREGVQRILAQEANIEVTAQATSFASAGSLLGRVKADVVLVDLVSANGLEEVRAIIDHAPGSQFIAIGIEENGALVADCAEAGFVSYVHRRGSAQDLIDTIRGAASGELHCSPTIAAELMRRVAELASVGTARGGETNLTRREIQVVGLLDEGLTNKEIARRLSIATATVRNHVHNILDKLGARTRGEAAAIARRLLTTGTTSVSPIHGSIDPPSQDHLT